MKKIVAVLLIMALLLASCSKRKGNTEEVTQDPLAVVTEDAVFHYGDTRETVEKVLGSESDAVRGMDYYRKYPDDTQIIYREIDGEEQAVFIMVKLRKFTTYQGIGIGDIWDEVKGKLGEIAQANKGAILLFENSERIDPWTPLEERSDECISLSYWIGDDGTIEMIAISDHLAATAFM